MSQFSVISTTRWDGILSSDVIHAFWLLGLHRQRLLNAVLQFHEHGDISQGKGAWGPTIKLLQSKNEFEHEVLTQFTQQADIIEGPFRVRMRRLNFDLFWVLMLPLDTYSRLYSKSGHR